MELKLEDKGETTLHNALSLTPIMLLNVLLHKLVFSRLPTYLPCYATAYGNGVSPPKIPRTAAAILKKG